MRLQKDDLIYSFITSQVLKSANKHSPKPHELSLSLISLLNASTNLSRKFLASDQQGLKRRRVSYLNQALILPRRGLSSLEYALSAERLQEKTRQASCLLYNLNKDHLRRFVLDPANNFLVRFFHDNEDLEPTDPYCRVEDLRSLLFFG